MQIAKNGDSVKVHYTGKHTDGDIFDSSAGKDPLDFELGKGQMIQGFEAAVLGMSVGETKTVNIPSDQAYGEFNEEMLFPINLADIPAHIELELGMPLNVQTNEGHAVQVLVREITEDLVILDANHPLAGMDLVFEINLIEITPAEEAPNKPLLFD
ncbi:MAG: peptidylprolyl isomerase [Microscillaceae bacterium]|nr:peptidylprolyl isomerase [Microscillaceae bacterium]